MSGTKAFLLSTKAVKDVEYHDIKEVTVTWGECSLHKWLNGSFLTTAFSKDEQAAILTTTVDNAVRTKEIRYGRIPEAETQKTRFFCSAMRSLSVM